MMITRVPSLLYLILIRLGSWPVPLGRSSASKNAELLVLLHEVAALRRTRAGPGWTRPTGRCWPR
jgi:hypothetical protein